MRPPSSSALTAFIRRVLVPLLLFSISISSSQLLFAQQLADAYPVILKKLERQKEETSEVFEHTFLAERQKMLEQFRGSILELEEHLVFLREKPDDPVRQANYEEALSRALTEASDQLAAFQNLQPQVLKAVNGLRATIEEAQEECRQSGLKAERQLAERSQSVTAIEDRLRTLAAKYSVELSDDTPLPPDVALNVRLLEADLLNAREACRLAGITSNEMQQRVAELGTDSQKLLQLRDDLTVNFRRAGGQRWLLANIAEIKQSRASHRQFRSKVNVLLSQLPKLAPTLSENEVRILFEGSALPDHPVTPPSGADAPRSTDEREFLKRYIPQPTPTTPDQTTAH